MHKKLYSLIIVSISFFTGFIVLQKTSLTVTTASTSDTASDSTTAQSSTSEQSTPELQVATIKPASMLFDLNGVLFAISKKRAIARLGFFDILSYTMAGHKVEALEDVIFDILYQIDGAPTPTKDYDLVPMHSGKPLPTIMCNWMRGTITSQQVIDSVLPFLDKLYKDGFFKNKTEKKLVTKIITMMFDPEIRCEIYRPLKKGINLLKVCKSLGHKVYLLSNMDSELIQLLQQKYPDVFALFDGVIISADIKMIKPNADIYLHTLKQFNINPLECYFIDDQKENITGAKRLKICAIHHDQHKTKKTYRRLIKHGVLPHDILPPRTAVAKKPKSCAQANNG